MKSEPVSRTLIETGRIDLATKPQLTSGGIPIYTEWIRSASPGLSPVVLVLHGASGVSHANSQMRRIAGLFSAHGYNVCLVHYFDRTGTSYASDDEIRDHYETWVETVQDALTYVSVDRESDSRRIAIFGYSLGAYLAVTAACRDPRIAAVIELAGGLDPESALKTDRLPPIMIIHGEDDRRVPVREATALENFVVQIGTPYETHIYPGEGHVLSMSKSWEAIAHGLTFLDKHFASKISVRLQRSK